MGKRHCVVRREEKKIFCLMTKCSHMERIVHLSTVLKKLSKTLNMLRWIFLTSKQKLKHKAAVSCKEN